MNIIALKYACKIICINLIKTHWQPKLLIINPNCLKVDKATIFFISFSFNADKLAMVIVLNPKSLNIADPWKIFIHLKCRINK